MFLISMVQSFLYGLTLPLSAARLILTKTKLLVWSALPIGVTLVLYIYGIRALQSWAMTQMNQYFQSWGFNPEGWAAVALSFLLQLVLLLMAALTFTVSSSIVASPFNDFLAEKTEAYATPALPAVSEKGVSYQIKLIGIDILKALGALGAGILALLLSWIPIVNMGSFILMFLLIAFQYVSYPQTRRGLGLRQSARFLFRHFSACVGFGATLTFLFSIPFVSSFILPIAVVGGTLLVARAPGGQNLPRLR